MPGALHAQTTQPATQTQTQSPAQSTTTTQTTSGTQTSIQGTTATPVQPAKQDPNFFQVIPPAPPPPPINNPALNGGSAAPPPPGNNAPVYTPLATSAPDAAQKPGVAPGTPAPSGSQTMSPATAPARPPMSMPSATPIKPYATMPPTTQQATPYQSAPAATPAPQPVVVPAVATPQNPSAAMPPYVPYGIPDEDRVKVAEGSAYIPVDSWIYPQMLRLYSMGFAETEYLAMRPWTRQSVLHILDDTEDDIRDSDNDAAKSILVAVRRELQNETPDATGRRPTTYGVETYYTRVMGISGGVLRDSYHLGQSIHNDYGRPYQSGFNMIAGVSTLAEYGRFSLYVRGEYQHSPSANGYSPALAAQLAKSDLDPYTVYQQQDVIFNLGPLPAQNPFRLVEATLSFHLLGHEISGGKSDAWLGPAQGGSLAWGNNAEDIYSFRINRVEPLHIPYLSALLGNVRYDFFYGSLKGHSDPNHPYVDSAMFSFAPTKNFQFTFQRTIEFGGAGHSPVTLHTFLHSFFNLNDTTSAVKLSRDDPGARFSDFSASYRLPFVRKYVTFYADSISHDDVTPISAPRRASYRTGLYLSQIPGARRFDLRVEAVSTDPRVSVSSNGEFMYFETIQRQAYTNKGYIFGDSIGREGKGGNATLTYHLSGDELIQADYLNKKNDKDFVGGTTQNQFKISALKRFDHQQLEVNAYFQYEKWKAPIYVTGAQTDTTTAIQLTYYPGLHTRSVQ